jgi:hypothetical protein
MSETVDMAHSEVRSLVTKAARGAGMSWGMAEEAGWAADWLARRAMPAAEWATLWLAKVLEGRPNAVEAGVMFADQRAAEGEPFDFAPLPDDLFAPGFILPFLHLVAMRYGAVEITSTSGRAALVGPDGVVTFGPAWSDRTSCWLVGLVKDAQPGRLAVPATVVDCLEGLALNTTVPPSDTSRRDAGSSTTDND